MKLMESIVIYALAVFLPMGSLWVAFSLRGGIFSAIFSFILWVILGYNIFDIVVYSGGGVFSLLEPFFVGNIDHLVLFGHA
ncbi:flagellar biosynthesis protein FlgG [Helicobacter pylori]|nr:flagellar biosynthesis protein FlgG [Helicobacter pylori]WRB28136.1 flagellar biosynthesis protein FlgG [Helicobacter pylori]